MPSITASQVHLRIVGQCSRWSDTGLCFIQGCTTDDAELTVYNSNKKGNKFVKKKEFAWQYITLLSKISLSSSAETISFQVYNSTTWNTCVSMDSLYYHSLLEGFSWMFCCHEPPHVEKHTS